MALRWSDAALWDVPSKPLSHMAQRWRVNDVAFEGCTNGAVKGGVCYTHGAKREVKRCSFKGCTNQVVRGGICVTHGAIKVRKRCSLKGCTNFVQKGGVCWTHGANAKCDGGKTMQLWRMYQSSPEGGVCVTNGAKRKRCSFEGCTDGFIKGGVCWTHGAKGEVKR